MFLKAKPLGAQAGALLAPQRINVANKEAGEDLIGALRALRSACPGADVCLHYSLVGRAPRPCLCKCGCVCLGVCVCVTGGAGGLWGS